MFGFGHFKGNFCKYGTCSIKAATSVSFSITSLILRYQCAKLFWQKRSFNNEDLTVIGTIMGKCTDNRVA